MISVDEALQRIAARARQLPPQPTPLGRALGRVLAQPVACDRDSPPWDKSMVDGFALVAADLCDQQARLTVIEEVMAGQVPRHVLQRGQATRIMTGAPIPQGCDAVVMVERTELIDDGSPLGLVAVREQATAGQNILRQGTAMRAGDVILQPGTPIRAIELGVLAEVGAASVLTIPPPRVAVLSTGDELVSADQTPGPGQIRNSNGPMLLAAVTELGAEAIDLGIVRDQPDALRQAIARGLEADLLVLSGGVSAGVLDLVPKLLAEAGVEQDFHKLRLKPGKPLWFGQRSTASSCLVFGLPGNPVSSFVCFQLFVRPAIGALAGKSMTLASEQLPLAAAFKHRGDRPTYHPARIVNDGGERRVEPVRWQGSADLYGLAQAEAMAHFPAGDHAFAPGDVIEVLGL